MAFHSTFLDITIRPILAQHSSPEINTKPHLWSLISLCSRGPHVSLSNHQKKRLNKKYMGGWKLQEKHCDLCTLLYTAERKTTYCRWDFFLNSVFSRTLVHSINVLECLMKPKQQELCAALFPPG